MGTHWQVDAGKLFEVGVKVMLFETTREVAGHSNMSLSMAVWMRSSVGIPPLQ